MNTIDRSMKILIGIITIFGFTAILLLASLLWGTLGFFLETLSGSLFRSLK